MPNIVMYIGAWAFWGCYGLNSITIPERVVSIGIEAFYVIPLVIYDGNVEEQDYFPWGANKVQTSDGIQLYPKME